MMNIEKICGMSFATNTIVDTGYWNRIEAYIHDHSEADFTHGICPTCARELYPELYEDDQ